MRDENIGKKNITILHEEHDNPNKLVYESPNIKVYNEEELLKDVVVLGCSPFGEN